MLSRLGLNKTASKVTSMKRPHYVRRLVVWKILEPVSRSTFYLHLKLSFSQYFFHSTLCLSAQETRNTVYYSNRFSHCSLCRLEERLTELHTFAGLKDGFVPLGESERNGVTDSCSLGVTVSSTPGSGVRWRCLTSLRR